MSCADRTQKVTLTAMPKWVPTIAIGLALATAGSAQLQPRFQSPTSYNVGMVPIGMAVGDLDLDGHEDLVVASSYSNTVSVLLGLGEGAFGPKTEFGVGSFALPGAHPVDVAIGLFDSDDLPDVAVANAFVSRVAVLLGNGDGTLGTPTNYVIGPEPWSIAAGDLDGDGDIDLVTALTMQNRIAILWGSGLGSFTGPTYINTGSGARAVAIGDANGDRRSDLAVANEGADTVSLILGQGGGAFGSVLNYPTGDSPRSVVFRDLSGDGLADVAVANGLSDSLSVRLAQSGGMLGPEAQLPVGDDPTSVDAADVNGDGLLDLLSGNYFGNSVSMALATPGGGFAQASEIEFGSSLIHLDVTDVSGNGIADLVGTIADGQVAVLLGEFGALFKGPKSYPVGDRPRAVAFGDMNGDGRNDMVVANEDDLSISVLIALPGSAFKPAQDIGVGHSPVHLALADIDGDADLDVVTVCESAGVVSVLKGFGNGSFGAPTDYPVGLDPRAVALGDLDNDLDADIAVAVHDSDAVAVLLNAGNGVFASAVPHAAGDGPACVAIDDMDGNGVPDLVSMNDFSADVSVLKGLGGGAFGAPSNYATLPFAALTWMSVGDVDGDGLPDVVITCDKTLEDTVALLSGLGGGALGPVKEFETGSLPLSVALGDLTGDGRLDVAVASSEWAAASIHASDEARHLAPAISFCATFGAEYCALGDANRDGWLDLAVVSREFDKVTVVLNQTGNAQWHAIDVGLAGLNGIPKLTATGVLLAGTPGAFALSKAAPSSLAALLFSLEVNVVPFKCGTLAASPVLFAPLVPTNASGGFTLGWIKWPAAFTGVDFCAQCAVLDASAPCGVSLSNALLADVPWPPE